MVYWIGTVYPCGSLINLWVIDYVSSPVWWEGDTNNIYLCGSNKEFSYRAIGLMSWVFANGLADWGSVSSWVIPKTQK